MTYPDLIQIETTTVCNASCWMCPRDTATRSNHRNKMSEAVFKKTVREAVELGVKMVLPFIDGEPLSDPRMVDFVEWMAEVLPADVLVGWYTNGSLLTEDKARRLLATKKIPWFNVSMQGGDKETYERNQGLDWERTIENMERLIAINREMGGVTQVRANMCVGSPSKESVQAFKERWGKFPEVLICLGAFSNFGGHSKDTLGESHWLSVNRKVCNRGTKHIYVFWDGVVGQCCFDLWKTIEYGNVAEQSLREIWESPLAVAKRQAHLELRVQDMPAICHNCNSPKFAG